VGLAARLASVPLTAAYTSDLSRARETAEVILAGRDGVSLESTPALREVSHGDWEGLTHAEAQARYPQDYPRRFVLDNPTFAPPGGESVAALLERMGLFGERVRMEHSNTDDHVLLVSHGGALRGLALHLLGLPLSAFWRFRIAPGSLSVIALWPDREATLELWNDTSHLEDAHDRRD
jgi:broad specificity phosphatase PhoE